VTVGEGKDGLCDDVEDTDGLRSAESVEVVVKVSLRVDDNVAERGDTVQDAVGLLGDAVPVYDQLTVRVSTSDTVSVAVKP